MKRTYLFLLLAAGFLCMFNASEAQPVAKYLPGKTPVGFETEINDFLRLDSASFPPAGACLFTGSSTIRLWHSMEEDFPGLTVIRRGFGGSTMEALNYYIHDIVLPYRPSMIIVYEGDNELAGGTTPQEFVARCDTFIRRVHEALPETTVWFISVKPSIARKKNLDVQQEANLGLKALTAKHEKTGFIDITGLMYDRKGRLRENYFEADSLHINRDCYSVWARHIKKALRTTK